MPDERTATVTVRGEPREVMYWVDASGPGYGISVEDWCFLSVEDNRECGDLTAVEEQSVIEQIVSHYDPHDYPRFDDDAV